MRLQPILVLFLALGSCRSVAPPGTYFDTRPAGAEVLIDGRLTGYVTPCMIALDRGDDHHVSFELAGFEMRKLKLEPGSQSTWVAMNEGRSTPHGQQIPLNLQAFELFLPRITNNSLKPGRVFLRLHPKRK